MEYQTNVQLRIIDFDKAGNIKISSLLSIMQEAADGQTKAVALNNDSMMKDGHAWILTRQGIKLFKNNDYGSELMLTTGALPSKTIEFPREYKLSTLSGEVVAYSIGCWSVLDVANRRLVRATEVPGYSELLLEKEPEVKFTKLRGGDIDGGELIAEHIVKNCEIDILGHLNNTFYPDMIYNALSDEEFASKTSEFNITYVNEAKCGEKIMIYKTADSDKISIVGKLDNCDTCFIAEIKY